MSTVAPPSARPSSHAVALVGHVALVADVAGQHDIPARLRADEIGGLDLQRHAVGVGVERHGGQSEAVDIGRDDAGRACLGGGDPGEAGAGAEIQHALSRDERGMIQQMPRQRLPARPCEGPEGRRQADLAQLLLGLQPERRRLRGEVQHDFGGVRDGDELRMRADEGRTILGGIGKRNRDERQVGRFKHRRT